jgi:hypothetical protein
MTHYKPAIALTPFAAVVFTLTANGALRAGKSPG